MMPNLPEIYNDAFFEEWGRSHEKYVQSAQKITEILMSLLNPQSIIDVGSGCGVYSYFFKERKVKVTSIDGVEPPPDHSFDVQTEIRDITVPFQNIWGRHDYVLCLEVAEHIPEKFADTFLKNLMGLSDKIILSAAPPNQGGHHHVNEQPKRYWVQKMANLGFIYNRKKTGQLQEKFKDDKPHYMWMCEHISIFEKRPVSKGKLSELAFGIKPTPAPAP